MINRNVLKFGYKDIAVGASSFNQEMTFQQFKPPADNTSGIKYIGKEIVIKFSYEDYRELKNLLREVFERNRTIFEFKGYVFDFTKYNEENIKLCIRCLNNAMAYYFMNMAT